MFILCTALVALAAAIAFPWSHYHSAAYPVVLCLAAACFMLAPTCFILGFAGFGGVAAALKEDAEALNIHLAGAEAIPATEVD